MMNTKQKAYPNDWQEKKLGENVELITKGTTPTSVGYDFISSGVNFIKIESIDNCGKINNKKIAHISEECNMKLKRSQLKENDILFSIAGALGRVALVKKENLPANTNQALSIIRLLNNKSKIDLKFLLFYLNSAYIKKNVEQINVQAAQANLSLKNINDFKIIIPPISEQMSIVKILETWDEYLEKITKKIEIKKNIRKGLMQKLLTGEVRLAEFSDEWINVKLFDIGKTYPGITGKDKNDFGTGKPFISYMNIYSNPKLNIQINDLVDIKEGEKQNKAQYGDLFFTTSSETPNEVGISSVLLEKNVKDLYLNSFCFGFRLNNFKTIAPEFAQFYFRGQRFRKQMARIAQGASRFNLSKKYFLETEIKIPKEIKEQTAIAQILTNADEEIKSLEKKKKIIEKQKSFLLNNLVTGKIRIPEFSKNK